MVRKLLMLTALTAAIVMFSITPAFAQDTGGDFGAFAPAITALVAIFGTLIVAARGITWVVDRVRDAVPFGDDARFKILWPALALVVGLFATLGFDGTNLIGDALSKLPQGSDALQGTFGKVVTAVVLAGLASSWHDRDVAKNPPTA